MCESRVLADKSQTILTTIYKENVKSMIKRKKKGLIVRENGEISEIKDKSNTVRTDGRGSYDRHDWNSVDVKKCIAMYSVCPTHYFSGRDGELERNISKKMELVTFQDNSSKSKSMRNAASRGDYQKLYLNMHPFNAQIFQTITEGVVSI